MRRYKINVNGTPYEVELEELTGAAPAAAAPAAAAAAAPADGEQVTCPIPGTILGINVNVGDAVEEGQVLMVLEAMKMENEIVSPKAGTVASINTSKGAAVDCGALLCVIA